MLSGGKGIHVIAPLTRRAEWPEVKAFCKGFADQLGADAPERYVSNMAKAKRKGRIFVDYLRNERGSTAIAPYSTRSRDGAPVAAPITWEEVKTVAGRQRLHRPEHAGADAEGRRSVAGLFQGAPVDHEGSHESGECRVMEDRTPPPLDPARHALFLDFDGSLVDFALTPDEIVGEARDDRAARRICVADSAARSRS